MNLLKLNEEVQNLLSMILVIKHYGLRLQMELLIRDIH